MNYATYSTAGDTFYGAVTDDGMIPLNDEFPQWPTLFDVVQAGGLDALAILAGKTYIKNFL